ncbi:cation transporter [Luteimonas sp. MC1895]|uniref:cation diffusion facilitator family transporter n=1 Tax=Luteimonas sp. MC1895 TaxID=2819513 RepID=UPI001F487B18|nr:cation transporter [Luteimonas sp. MC1895]
MDRLHLPSTDAPAAGSEQAVLRASIFATVLVAALGIVAGLASGSFAIVFDGVYSLFDALASMLALLVANMIAAYGASGERGGELEERFTMGVWHLEPMVLGATGLLLIGSTSYALINAIGSFLSGGRELQFGQAIAYAVVTLAVSLAMAAYGHRANRRLRSPLVLIDVQAWLISAAITAALLVAFVVGVAIQGTRYDWMVPYVDPAVLALVCLVILPLPLRTVRAALADVLMVTPPLLKQHVDAVARAFVEREGFLSHRAYVVRKGRGRHIEVFFIVPRGWPARTLEAWDELRDEIGEAIGEDSPDRWLTIAFTADREWA